MKNLVFDAGPIISLTVNGLLWLVGDLNKSFQGDFYITDSVKKEIVDTPLQSKRYKFEAIKVLHQIDKGSLKIVGSKEIVELGDQLMDYANKTFKLRGNYLKLVDKGEMHSVAVAILFESEALVTDERITRFFIESPERLKALLKRRHHTNLTIDQNNLNKFHKLTKNIKVIRSLELVTIAYEKGLLDKYISAQEEKDIPDLKKKLLESVLWGVKINGCAASREDIDEIIKIEGF